MTTLAALLRKICRADCGCWLLLVVVTFALLVAPAHAQPAPGMHRLGFINVGPAGPNAGNLAAVKEGLAELGYVEGKNLELIVRWGEGRPERLPALVAEIMAAKPKLILSTGGPVTAKAVVAGAIHRQRSRCRDRHQQRAAGRDCFFDHFMAAPSRHEEKPGRRVGLLPGERADQFVEGIVASRTSRIVPLLAQKAAP